MKLKYGEYQVDGWGGIGIYDEEQVIGHTDDKEPRPIVSADAIIAGHGPGWDNNAIFDGDVLEELVDLYNSAHSKSETQ